jgi:hypothetical protein
MAATSIAADARSIVLIFMSLSLMSGHPAAGIPAPFLHGDRNLLLH